MDVSVEDLEKRYLTHCDPRLNASQAIELAFLMAKELNDMRRRRAANGTAPR